MTREIVVRGGGSLLSVGNEICYEGLRWRIVRIFFARTCEGHREVHCVLRESASAGPCISAAGDSPPQAFGHRARHRKARSG